MRPISPVLLTVSCLLIACNHSTSTEMATRSTAPTPRDLSHSQVGSLCERPARQKPLVVTTVAPLTNIISNIAGERVEIKGLIAEGTDSHTFLPRPIHTRFLASADLIIVNGLELETPTTNLAKAVKCADTKLYELGNNTVKESQWIFDFSFPKNQGKPNPHLWVNPKYAENYARLATQWLTELDAEGANYYATNLKRYLQRLQELDAVSQAVVASIPPQNRKLLTYHDSWAYWAREYGFTVIGAIQPSSFKEPSEQDITLLIDQIDRERIPVIWGSEVYPSEVEEKIAAIARVKSSNLADDDLPGDETTESSANAMENRNPEHTYLGMMALNLRLIATHLGGKPELVDRLNTADVVGPTTGLPQP